MSLGCAVKTEDLNKTGTATTQPKCAPAGGKEGADEWRAQAKSPKNNTWQVPGIAQRGLQEQLNMQFTVSN